MRGVQENIIARTQPCAEPATCFCVRLGLQARAHQRCNAACSCVLSAGAEPTDGGDTPDHGYVRIGYSGSEGCCKRRDIHTSSPHCVRAGMPMKRLSAESSPNGESPVRLMC